MAYCLTLTLGIGRDKLLGDGRQFETPFLLRYKESEEGGRRKKEGVSIKHCVTREKEEGLLRTIEPYRRAKGGYSTDLVSCASLLLRSSHPSSSALLSSSPSINKWYMV